VIARIGNSTEEDSEQRTAVKERKGRKVRRARTME
jgi:hypothetical protein